MDISALGEITIRLIRCAIHGCSLPEFPEKFNIKELYSFLRRHLISASLYDVIKRACNDEAVLKKLEEEYISLKIQADSLKQENKRILTLFDEENLDVMPIKGYELEQYYPDDFFRRSLDIDIVFDADKTDKLKELMARDGYILECENDKDLSYYKPPFFCYEFHKHITANDQASFEYFSDILMRSPLNDNYKNIHRMTKEGLYIYTLVHFHKHFVGGGAGIRFLLDLYFVDKALFDEIDKTELFDSLQKMNLYNFYQKMKSLAYKLFDEESNLELDDGESLICKYMYMQGCFGSDSGHIMDLIKKKSQNARHMKYFYYIWYKYLFQERRYKNYPILKKSYALLPLCFVHRIIKCSTIDRKKVKKDYQSFLKYEDFVDSVFLAAGLQ
ncbi:MAG: nucleotidyltransferase family protein [Clostridia bacterium]|nr:nucleotidyltransferase family protein [Clostridia bacterium]